MFERAVYEHTAARRVLGETSIESRHIVPSRRRLGHHTVIKQIEDPAIEMLAINRLVQRDEMFPCTFRIRGITSFPQQTKKYFVHVGAVGDREIEEDARIRNGPKTCRQNFLGQSGLF